MDDYSDIIRMLEKIKGNAKALAYIKLFLKDFINTFC